MKNKTTIYYNPNSLQKGLISFIRLFKNEQRTLLKLRNRGIDTYTPKLSKVRLGVAISVFMALCITPFTPQILLIPKLTQFALK